MQGTTQTQQQKTEQVNLYSTTQIFGLALTAVFVVVMILKCNHILNAAMRIAPNGSDPLVGWRV
jgi:hypothetical protein